MATSSILAWEIPWTEEPSGLWSMRLKRIRHDWATKQQQRLRKEPSLPQPHSTQLGVMRLESNIPSGDRGTAHRCTWEMPRPFPVFLRSLLVACHPAGSPSWILWQWASIGWSGQKPPCQPLRAGHWEGRANDHLSLMSVQTGHGESSRLGAWFGHHGWDPSRRWEFAGLWALQLRGSSRKPSCGFSSLKVSQTWEGKMKWYFQERGLTGFLEKQ